jgi:hypothetical protein
MLAHLLWWRACRYDCRARRQPYDTEPWEWPVGFYPGSHPDEHRIDTAATFDEARAKFEAAWAVFLSNRTETDFQEWREAKAWTAWKYQMWDTRHQLPTQLPGGCSKCICGAGWTIAGMAEHVRSAQMEMAWNPTRTFLPDARA